MKGRTVYPQLWLDDKFVNCAIPTKLLFCYLVNNVALGLTPYLHITDRQIMFDTGLDPIQLKQGKDELTGLKWCFFYENWVYHNHACALVDYTGRDIVMAAKEKELNSIPLAVKEYFNPLITRYQPVITITNNINITNTITKGTEEKVEKIKEQTRQMMAKKGMN